MQIERAYLESVIRELCRLKERAEKAIAQVSDEGFFAQPDSESNSIAILIKHLAGNMRSRWTDFLTTDGEKPDRARDSEFIIGAEDTRAFLEKRWETEWRAMLDVLSGLEPQDLGKTVSIRGESHSVLRAVNRHLVHCANHVGQIVLLAKHFAGAGWKTVSIPRGKSEEFRDAMSAKWKAEEGA